MASGYLRGLKLRQSYRWMHPGNYSDSRNLIRVSTRIHIIDTKYQMFAIASEFRIGRKSRWIASWTHCLGAAWLIRFELRGGTSHLIQLYNPDSYPDFPNISYYNFVSLVSLVFHLSVEVIWLRYCCADSNFYYRALKQVTRKVI